MLLIGLIKNLHAFSLHCITKNRSKMRTSVAYKTELLFSVCCLKEFLLEELISDYGKIVFNIFPVHQ